MPSIAPSQSFPIDNLTFVQGQKFTLDDAKHKNIVVIESWATWCGPCRTSIPHLNSLYQKFGKRGVLFVGVTNESDRTAVTRFISSMGNKMTYPVALDEDGDMSSYESTYSIKGIPHALIIDHNGKVVWSGHPMQSDFEDKLDVLANELAQFKAKQSSTTSSSGTSSTNAVKVKEMSEADLKALSIKQLIDGMKAANIDMTGCIEKSELIDRIRGVTHP